MCCGVHTVSHQKLHSFKLFTVSDTYFDHLGKEIYLFDGEEEKPANITQSERIALYTDRYQKVRQKM